VRTNKKRALRKWDLPLPGIRTFTVKKFFSPSLPVFSSDVRNKKNHVGLDFINRFFPSLTARQNKLACLNLTGLLSLPTLPG
jgi:hypothetical protein